MTLQTTFNSLKPRDQSGIFFCLSLAAFIEHCIENDFVPAIEAIIEKPCAGANRKKIILELATAMAASCDFSDGKSSAELYGRDPDLLRGIIVMLILADSDDPAKVRQKTIYSRNRDEARAQAVSEALRILKMRNKKTAAQLDGIEFSKKWNELSATLVPGALHGMRKMMHFDIIASALRRIGFLSPTSKAVLQEYIKIITVGISKEHNGK